MLRFKVQDSPIMLDASGSPVKNAIVEIWQCDANAVYLHTADSGSKSSQHDKNFQGFGRCETGSKGEYYFRTIKPVKESKVGELSANFLIVLGRTPDESDLEQRRPPRR